jgi:alkanesulfonate monooxygenase SsuD/methylene tetrahydromethanopterin reductase-like flavin-dependent oxidoreductase (luciferase family)
MALNPYANAADEFPGQVRDLLCWLADTPLPDDHPFRAIRANPTGATRPEVWILGSSDYGAQLAAHFGLPYAYAYFFSDGRGVEKRCTCIARAIGPAPIIPSRRHDLRLGAGRRHGRRGTQATPYARALARRIRAGTSPPPAAARRSRRAGVYADEQGIIERLRAKALVGTRITSPRACASSRSDLRSTSSSS